MMAQTLEQDQRTTCEIKNTRRWGRYLTQLETEMLHDASSIAGGSGDALDVGCDGGRYSKVLSDLGWNLTCTDREKCRLELCRKRLPSARCLLVDAAEESLPVDSSSMNLVVCLEVLEVGTAKWFPGELYRVLRPGGVALFTFFNSMSLRGVVHRIIHGFGNNSPNRFFYVGPSYGRYRRLVTGAGLKMVRELGFCWAPFSRGSDSPLIPAAVRLEKMVGLRNLPSLSPWVLVMVRKGAEASS